MSVSRGYRVWYPTIVRRTRLRCTLFGESIMLNYHPDNALEENDLLSLEMSCGKWDEKTQQWILGALQEAVRGQIERIKCSECDCWDH